MPECRRRWPHRQPRPQPPFALRLGGGPVLASCVFDVVGFSCSFSRPIDRGHQTRFAQRRVRTPPSRRMVLSHECHTCVALCRGHFVDDTGNSDAMQAMSETWQTRRSPNNDDSYGTQPRPPRPRALSRKEVAWNPHARGAHALTAQPRAGRGEPVGSRRRLERESLLVRTPRIRERLERESVLVHPPGKGREAGPPGARYARRRGRDSTAVNSAFRNPHSKEGPSRPQDG